MKLTLLALMLLATAAQAESTRLAFSKAEDVEVFVDHKATTWCGSDLALRFVYAKPAEAIAVERLMPKIGTLIGNQCDQAERLRWTATGTTDVHLEGVADKATAWTAQISSQGTAGKPDGPGTTPAEQPQVPTSAVATVPSSPKPDTTPATPVPPLTTAQPSPVLEKQPAVPATIEPVPTKERTSLIAIDFDVAGWRPGDGEAELAKSNFITTIKDAQGCSFRVPFKAEEEGRYLQVRSNGVRCENGLAQGEGELVIERSDGKQLQRWTGFFRNGLPFDKPLPDLRLVGFDEQKQALFLLASDPGTASYSLLRLGYNGTRWSVTAPDVIFVTGNNEQFRQIDQIRPIITRTQQQLDALGTNIPRFTFLAVRDFTKGIFSRPWDSGETSQDFWLYRANVGRNWSNKTWQFNPEQATNFLFNWDEKQVRQREQAERQREREAQQARMQTAFRARDQLATYERLTQEAQTNPQVLLARQVVDVRYNSNGGGNYTSLIHGETKAVRLISRVTKTSTEDWTLDYPYPIQAQVPAGTPAKNGWYVLSGAMSLDPSTYDADDLPVTRLSVKALQPCANEGCSDLRDPLALVRVQFEDPAWTPEVARQQLKDAGFDKESF